MKKVVISSSLKVMKPALAELEKVSGRKVVLMYNDLYETKKKGWVRRLKVYFKGSSRLDYEGWIDKKEWSQWALSNKGKFKVEFDKLNKLISVGGKKQMEYNKEYWIQSGRGTAKEYDDTFNNKSVYFVIRIY